MSARRKQFDKRTHKKSRKKRELKTLVLIVCEGEETEVLYFNNFRSKLRVSNVEIRAVSQGHTDPVGIVKDAIKEIRDASKSGAPLNLKSGDYVWCVFDANSNTDDQLREARKLANKNSIKIAFSNPCFEIWYWLHFRDASKFFNNCKQLINEMQEIPELSDYNKNYCIYEKIKDKEKDAINRCKNRIRDLEEERIKQYSRESNPSTSVYELVELLNGLKEG